MDLRVAAAVLAVSWLVGSGPHGHASAAPTPGTPAVIPVAVAAPGSAAAPEAVRLAEPITPLPPPPEANPAHVSLGRMLFHDPRLSRSGRVSCASCHPLAAGGAEGRWLSLPAGDVRIQRDTPTIFNTGLNIAYNWDGSARTPHQVLDRVVEHRYRLDSNWELIRTTLLRDQAMVNTFAAAYPDGMTVDNLRGALVTYQRSLVTPNARFDRHLRGEANVLNALELKGYALFKSIGCVACHQGMNVGGNLFQRFGVFHRNGTPAGPEDLGRYWLTGLERDRGVFRVPSLRNVEITAPYFHDGRAATLRDAVQIMARVQLDRELSAQDNEAIVAFLKTLTGELDGRPLAAGSQRAEPGQR